MGREVQVTGFSYAPVTGDDLAGTIYKYAFYISSDGEEWTKCDAAGEFSNIMHNPVPYFVRFGKSYRARYFKLEPLAEINGKVSTAIGEVGILAVKGMPKDDETLVYDRPGAPLKLRPGDNHPKVKGWRFYTAHEFLNRDTENNLPKGFIEHRGAHMSRAARVDNARCSEVNNGVLQIRTVEETDSVDNRFGANVKFSHGCYRTSLPGSKDFWCNFTENMRIEIRFKRNAYQGFNDALWFMGNNNRPWPKNGEIDLLENPKKTVNNRAHFTLHSENYYAGVVGGSGSVTSTIDLADMSWWNIYWLEWYPDRIVGGVNGQTYFEHRKGANGNEDWPWSDPAEDIPGAHDIQGRIGGYWHGNEPCHHVAYLYNYLGQPWKCQRWVREIAARFYGNEPGSLSGNDDCGQMSAWYMFNCLGIYPVAPSSNFYNIGSPCVKSLTIMQSNGKQIKMTTDGWSEKAVYVKELYVNGQQYDKSYLPYDMVKNGIELHFVMSEKPAYKRGVSKDDIPPSISSSSKTAIYHPEK